MRPTLIRSTGFSSLPLAYKVATAKKFSATALQPDGWFVAELDGQWLMVGTVDYGEFAYIGLMAVHQRCSARGIGRALRRGAGLA
jgi:hypothetical protein